MAVVVNLIGGILLIGGWVAAFLAARDRRPQPPPGWFPDPSIGGRSSGMLSAGGPSAGPLSAGGSSAGGAWAGPLSAGGSSAGLPLTGGGERLWDGRTWTPWVRAAPASAVETRRFHGRFWGGWAWIALFTLVVLAFGCFVFYGTGAVSVMALTSFVAMIGVCWAFYRFVARQLALDDVIGTVPLVFVGVATAGAVLLIASNANTAIIGGAGIRTGLITVGVIEEGTKLLVPLTLLAFGRCRDPRAGIAIGLVAGFSFAVIEATEYAYSSASASGPDLCGGTLPQPTVQSVTQAQVYRIFLVEPLHWLWTGFATAVAWRLWHLYPRPDTGLRAASPTADPDGAKRDRRKATLGAVAAIALVIVLHSLNDSSAGFGCDNVSVAFLAQVFRWALLIVMYVLLRAAARKSTPPQLIGLVSRGWTPHRLRTRTRV